MKRITAILLMLLLCFSLCSCGQVKVKADISSYENKEIVVKGLTDDEFTITPGELAQMECEKETVSAYSKGREITFKPVGPTLETFLAEYEVELSEVENIIFIAYDGYTKYMDSSFLKAHPVIYMSVCNGKDPLASDDQPLRLIVPGATPDNWEKGVVEIRVEL